MDERIERIQAFLVTQNASIDTLTKSRLTQFEKVDDAIQTRLQAVTAAKETLKTTGINVSVIAADTGISRKTFYNNDLLRLYVEHYAIADEEDSVAASDFDRIKTKNEELSAQVKAFVLRDIDSENLRHENMKLQQEIRNLNTRLQNLEGQYEQAQSEISDLRRRLSEKPGHIIQMPVRETVPATETPLKTVIDTSLVDTRKCNPIDLMLGVSAGTTDNIMNGLTVADSCSTKTVMLYCDNGKFRTSSLMVAKDYNIVLHGPLNVNIASDDPIKRKQGISIVESIIRRCNAVPDRIKCLVLHPGSSSDPTYLYDSLEYLLSFSKVKIAIETMAGKGHELVSTLDEMKSLQEHFSEEPNFGFCLDTCHMNDAGIDLSDFNAALSLIGRMIDLNKVSVIHINDSKNRIGSHSDRHANIGTGYIPVDTLKGFAQATVFAGIPKILETPQKEQGSTYPTELTILTSR